MQDITTTIRFGRVPKMTVKTALVTGSLGFVGRHMVETLQANGYDVVGCDTEETWEHKPFHCEDARDFFKYDQRQFDVSVHAAAFVGGRQAINSRQAFISAYDTQLDGAYFEWAMRTRPNHLVYISSSAAYPVKLQSPVNDIHLAEYMISPYEPYEPDNTYGWTKIMGEVTAEHYQKLAWNEWNGHTHVVRPFSGYGSDQDTVYPFRAFLERAMNCEDPFTVWGNPYQMRDWIHIDDVCNGIMAIINANMCEPVNLCTGIGTTMYDLIAMFCDELGHKPNLIIDNDMPMGVMNRVGNPSLMHTVYTPTIKIREGVTRAIKERMR